MTSCPVTSSSVLPSGDPGAVDFFTDPSLADDPFPWYEAARQQGPVWQEPHHGAFIVTGQAEVIEVLSDVERFSACASVVGPFSGLQVPPGIEDATDLIAEQRCKMAMNEYVVTMDPPDHTRHRALLLRLLTPKRLQASEAAVLELSDKMLAPLIERGETEFFWDYGKPFATTVVAELLGVPEEDHLEFRKQLGADKPGMLGDEGLQSDPLKFLNDYFSSYVEHRRKSPRQDVLTQLAAATFPDGELPDVLDVVRIATFLFAAGQDTSARLVVSAAHNLAEDAERQQWLRQHPEMINDFIEEVLRTQSPTKSTSRIAKRTTTVGGVTIPAGSLLQLVIAAANRDGREYDAPHEFRVDRRDPYGHVAFGRGAHACPGGSLARVEGRLTVQRLLQRTSSFRVSEKHHGPADNRDLHYDPTYIVRGLSRLHLELTPAAGA
jgi:cytochrome P450